MIKYFLYALLSCFYVSSFQAQSDTIFIYTYGNSFENKGEDILFTSAQDYFIVGSAFNEENASSDMYLLMLDGTFNKKWSFLYGSDQTDVAKGVVETPEGNFIIVGYSNAGLSKGYQVALLCVDATGQFLWEKKYGGAQWDFGYDIVPKYDQTYLICGATFSEGAGRSDAYILHVDVAGDTISTQTYGGLLDDALYRGVEALDSSLYFVGETTSENDSTNILLLKLNKSNVLEWQKEYGGSKYDVAYDIVQAANSDILLAGSSNSHQQREDLDIMTYRISANGDSLWSFAFAQASEGNLEDVGRSVLELSDNTTLNTGYTNTYGFGFQSIAFSKTDGSGNPISGPSPFLNYTVNESILANGKIIAVGSTDKIGSGNSDVLVIYAEQIVAGMQTSVENVIDTAVVSIAEEIGRSIGSKIIIYPNPVVQTFQVSMPNNISYRLKVFDVYGREVRIENMGQNTYTLSRTLPKGSYVVQLLFDNGQTISQKLFK